MKTLALSARAGILKPSPTLAITARAQAMRAAGEDVISFAAGEPDFPTPEPITRAAIEALEDGFTKYTPTSGVKELKEAVAEKLARENGLTYLPDQVVVSCGAKHALYNALTVLLDPGDEVVLIAPYWMTYAEQVRIADGEPVVVPTRPEEGFIPNYEDLKAAITGRTRAIILNSPSNPSGAVLPRETLKQIGALAIRHGLWIISDEIYERLVYDGEQAHSVGALGADVLERTITVGGVSKSFSMTGWRIGYAAAPLPVARAMSNLQDQVTSNPTSFAQKGAVRALRMEPAAVEAMRKEFEARRNLVIGLLEQVPGVQANRPKGAFYVLPRMDRYLGGKIDTDASLAEYLLEEAKVATVPGSVFEAPGHLRLSYACSREDIRRGVERMADALRQLAR